MAQITKGSKYIAFALYFFCYCSWGSRPALSSGVETPLEMRGRPTLAAA